MNHQSGAQENADIRNHRNIGIGDASGVLNEAPKGGR